MKLYFLVNDKFEYLKNNDYKDFFTNEISKARRYSRRSDARQSINGCTRRKDLRVVEVEFEIKNMSFVK